MPGRHETKLRELIVAGHVLKEDGQFAEAAQKYQAALELEPTSREARYHLGLSYRELGENDKADKELRQVVDVRGDLARRQWELAKALLRDQKADRAASMLQQVTEALPEDGAAWLDLAQALKGSGDSDGAKAAVNRALALNPESQKAQKLLEEL